MQIFIKGVWSKILTFDVDSSDTIGSIHARIQDELGIPPEHQVLILAGVTFKADRTLDDYNIEKESTIYLALPAACPEEVKGHAYSQSDD